jgi:hypothetical protein
VFNPYIDTDTAVDLYTWANQTFKDISGFNKEPVIDSDLFLKFVNKLNYIPHYEIVDSSIDRVFPNLSGYRMFVVNRGVIVEASIKEDTYLSNKTIQTFQIDRNPSFGKMVQDLCNAIVLITAENYYFRLLKQFIDESNETFYRTMYHLLSVAFFNFTAMSTGASGCLINGKRLSIFIDRKAHEDTALGVSVAYDGMSVVARYFTNDAYREF